MPPFPKPKFDYDYALPDELAALHLYRDTKPGRAIPAKSADRLLLGTWNIANLGLQLRRDPDYRLIAEMLSWFDLIAVQEVHDNLSGLRVIMSQLNAHYAAAGIPKPDGTRTETRYRTVFSDAAGNCERLAFIYDAAKVSLMEQVGEIALPPTELPHIKFESIAQSFQGFDRTPYLATFKAGSFTFTLVSVHLYFGDEKQASIDRRCLETYAVARWTDLERKSKTAYAPDIIALGDFNLPKCNVSDPVYRALTRRGLHLPQHSTEVGSALASDNHYDQIAFFTGETGQDFTGKTGVFDFDGALFKTLWNDRGKKQFNAFMKYYISDHRILWSEFKI